MRVDLSDQGFLLLTLLAPLCFVWKGDEIKLVNKKIICGKITLLVLKGQNYWVRLVGFLRMIDLA